MFVEFLRKITDRMGYAHPPAPAPLPLEEENTDRTKHRHHRSSITPYSRSRNTAIEQLEVYSKYKEI